MLSEHFFKRSFRRSELFFGCLSFVLVRQHDPTVLQCLCGGQSTTDGRQMSVFLFICLCYMDSVCGLIAFTSNCGIAW